MSKITICEGDIILTSKKDTIFHTFGGDMKFNAQGKNIWHGEKGNEVGVYEEMETHGHFNGGPIIQITNKQVGWGYIKLIGADDRKYKGSYITIGVPLYKMIVSHDVDPLFRIETDSWIVQNIEGNIARICNCSFEPIKNKTIYIGEYIDVYPALNDTAAYALRYKNSRVLQSEERYNPKGKLVNEAKDIMIHVGGIYFNEKDPTYNNQPRTRAGGSLGCFGIVNQDNSINNPSDGEAKSIIGRIRQKSDEDTILGYSSVKIIIEKRENVERIKNVILPH